MCIRDSLQGAPALVHVTTHAPNETDISIGVDEHFHIAQIANTRIGEEKNSIDDDDVRRWDDDRLLAARVVDEIVHRLFDRLAGSELLELRDKQLPIEGIRVI